MRTDTLRKDYIPHLCGGAVSKELDGADYALQCKRAAGLFHLLVGSAYNIAQGVMVDAAAELRRHKDLYRFQIKHDVSEALKGYDRVFAMERKDLGMMYEAWLDAIDIMDDGLREHLGKMYWSIDNTLLRHGVREHSLMARMETACAVVSVARKCFQSLCRTVEEQVYHRKARFDGLAWFSFKDVLFHWERACDAVGKRLGVGGIDLNADETCSLALRVVVNRIVDFNALNASTEKALGMHPEADPRVSDGIEALKEKYNRKV